MGNQFWVNAIPFFPVQELACKGTGVVKLDTRMAVELSYLRLKWGKPLTPTSVCRTPVHNLKEKGHVTSLHLTENTKWDTYGTMAADLYWGNWSKVDRVKFARLAWSLGWSIGLNNTFIHIDRRIDVGGVQHIFQYGDAWDGSITENEIK